MLTPDKIKNKEFHTSGKGSYRSEEVDDFMNEVYTSYEKVFRENGEIIKKMSLLANKVEEYKKDEDSLRQALLSAQKLADQITAEAKENSEKQIAEAKLFADEMISKAKVEAEALTAQAKTEADEKLYNANKEANEILGGVNRKITQEKLVLEMLQKEVGAFKNKMMDMYKEHLTLLDRLPSLAEEQVEEEPVQAQEPEAEAAEEVVEEAAEEVVTLENIAEEAEEDTIDLSDEADNIIDISDAEEAPAFEFVAEDDGFTLETADDDEEDETQDEEAEESLTDEFARIEETDEFKVPETVSYDPFGVMEDDSEKAV